MPCSVCKQPGHNMRTCINMPWPPTDPTRNLLHAWRRRNSNIHAWRRFNRTSNTPPVWRMRTTTTTTIPSPSPSPSITPTILHSERLISPSDLPLTPLPLTPLPLPLPLPLTPLPLTPRRRRREIPSDDTSITSSDDTSIIPSAGRRWVFEPQWRRESEIESILLDNQSLQRENIIMELVDCVDKPCHIDECPICMEDLLSTDTFTTRCGHMFHGTCMLIHTKLHDSCPLCRGVLIN